jgi:hypothetical protein
MITIGSVGTVLVWASQCLAFIRYFNWMRRHRTDLLALQQDDPDTYAHYNRESLNTKDRFYSLLSPMQPVPAYLGLLMCCLTVFIFSSATWWQTHPTGKKIAVAYAGVSILPSSFWDIADQSQPVVCAAAWLFLKAFRFYRERSWSSVPWRADLSHNRRRFQQIIAHFESVLYLREDDDDVVSTDSPEAPGVELKNTAPPVPGIYATPDEVRHQRTLDTVIGTGKHMQNGASEMSGHTMRLSES